MSICEYSSSSNPDDSHTALSVMPKHMRNRRSTYTFGKQHIRKPYRVAPRLYKAYLAICASISDIFNCYTHYKWQKQQLSIAEKLFFILMFAFEKLRMYYKTAGGSICEKCNDVLGLRNGKEKFHTYLPAFLNSL